MTSIPRDLSVTYYSNQEKVNQLVALAINDEATLVCYDDGVIDSASFFRWLFESIRGFVGFTNRTDKTYVLTHLTSILEEVNPKQHFVSALTLHAISIKRFEDKDRKHEGTELFAKISKLITEQELFEKLAEDARTVDRIAMEYEPVSQKPVIGKETPELPEDRIAMEYEPVSQEPVVDEETPLLPEDPCTAPAESLTPTTTSEALPIISEETPPATISEKTPTTAEVINEIPAPSEFKTADSDAVPTLKDKKISWVTPRTLAIMGIVFATVAVVVIPVAMHYFTGIPVDPSDIPADPLVNTAKNVATAVPSTVANILSACFGTVGAAGAIGGINPMCTPPLPFTYPDGNAISIIDAKSSDGHTIPAIETWEELVRKYYPNAQLPQLTPMDVAPPPSPAIGWTTPDGDSIDEFAMRLISSRTIATSTTPSPEPTTVDVAPPPAVASSFGYTDVSDAANQPILNPDDNLEPAQQEEAPVEPSEGQQSVDFIDSSTEQQSEAPGKIFSDAFNGQKSSEDKPASEPVTRDFSTEQNNENHISSVEDQPHLQNIDPTPQYSNSSLPESSLAKTSWVKV